MTDVTDPTLAQRAMEGDVEAFSHLLQRYDDRMRGVAYQILGSQSAMDDALQAAYLKAFRAIGNLRDEAGFASWLRRIVVNCCNDQLRGQKRRNEVALDSINEEPSTRSDTDRVIDSGRLNQALLALPPEMRAAVVLVDGEGLSYSEAAEMLSIERGTVASRLNRARAALRHQLQLGEES